MLKGSLEENVLTMLCWDVKHSPALAMRVQPELFSTRAYRDIATKAVEHIERHSAPPRAHLRDLLEDSMRRTEGSLIRVIVDTMEELQAEMQPSYVLGELDKFINLRVLSRALEDASDAIQEGDLDKAREALYSQSSTSPGLSKGILLNDPKQALGFLDEIEESTFLSGIPTLDEMGIKPDRKEVMLFIAPAKRGKTWFLINLAIQNMMNRKKVLHISLEFGEKKMAKRYVQSLFAMSTRSEATIRVPIFKRTSAGSSPSIDFDTITPDILDQESRAKITRRMHKLGNRPPLIIKEFPTGTLTLAQLRAYLDWLERTEGFSPDVLIIDYPDLMSISANNLRIDTGKMFQGLRGICVERNVAGVFVTQGNRTSSTARTVGANQVGEDYSKIGTADTILTYSQTPEERGLNLARILVAAARGDADQFVTLISQSYATGQFCLDSVYMEKQFASEIARLTGGEDQEGDE